MDTTTQKRASHCEVETNPIGTCSTREPAYKLDLTKRRFKRFPVPMGAVEDMSETSATVDRSQLTATCRQLNELCRHRLYIIRRQWLIERPSEQQFKRQLELELGKDHGLKPQQLFDKAAKIRKKAWKVVDPEWKELPGSALTEYGRNRIKELIVARNGINLTEQELNIISRLAVFAKTELPALNSLREERTLCEKQIEGITSELHVADWWCGYLGCNLGGLGKIIGETGDLFNYTNPAKVVKRMGLAPFKGKAGKTWATHKGPGGLTKEEWVEFGYCPRRKAVMHTISMPVKMNKSAEWRLVYDAEKLKKAKDRPEWTPGHVDNHALRYIEQQMLIALWCKWWGRT